MACLSLILCKKLLKSSKRIVSIPNMDEKKLDTWEFQLEGINRIQNLADALSLKYIKLVIPKILFILVLCSFNFYFKVTWLPQQRYPSPQQYNPLLKNKNFWPPPLPPASEDLWNFYPSPSPKLEGGCMPCVLTMICTKINCSGQMGYFGPEVGTSS